MRVATSTPAATSAGPRPVFCVTEHEHRDLALAAAVCEGRFTVAGETRALGTEADWRGADLPADEEWRIEWVKFAWGLDLAHAYAETGERAHLTAWERLAASWLAQMEPAADASEVTARRILNWIYAWQRFAAAPAFSGLADGLGDALRRSIAEQARHVRDHLAPERNHRTLELYALLVVALALPDLDRDGLLELAVSELDRNLRTDFRPDGVHREASTHYHVIVLRSFVGALENARRFGVALPDGFDARVRRACAFAMHCRRPDGTIPALSDSDGGDYTHLLAHAAYLLDDPELRYIASRGRAGRAPARRCVSFPDGGYHVQRSGWDGRERFLIFDCGPLGDGGHGHYDLLSFEACAGERALVVDPGRGSYSEAPPNLRRWFRGTAAHNTVCVDGLDQTPYRRGRSAGPFAEGRLLGRGSAPGLDLLAGAAVSPEYEVVHERRIAFVADSYWVIEDRLRGEHAHRFDLRFHLAPEALGHTDVVAEPGAATVLAPGLALVVLGAGAVGLEPGWVSPSYGRRLDAPVVSAVAEGRAEATFVTLLAPLRPGQAVPELCRVANGAGTTVQIGELAGPGSRETIAITDSGCRWWGTTRSGESLGHTTVSLGGGS
jgi:uncharacterized heparinase superfamily protein